MTQLSHVLNMGWALEQKPDLISSVSVLVLFEILSFAFATFCQGGADYLFSSFDLNDRTMT
jgi:hypothetical protein